MSENIKDPIEPDIVFLGLIFVNFLPLKPRKSSPANGSVIKKRKEKIRSKMDHGRGGDQIKKK